MQAKQAYDVFDVLHFVLGSMCKQLLIVYQHTVQQSKNSISFNVVSIYIVDGYKTTD